jgi:hypothetical protein
MSAFYLFGVIAVWLKLTSLIWKFWRTARRKAEAWGRGRGVGIALAIGCDLVFAVFALVWLSASFWYSGGRKYYYDAEIDRLCAIDGGDRVYETVKLPAERNGGI